MYRFRDRLKAYILGKLDCEIVDIPSSSFSINEKYVVTVFLSSREAVLFYDNRELYRFDIEKGAGYILTEYYMISNEYTLKSEIGKKYEGIDYIFVYKIGSIIREFIDYWNTPQSIKFIKERI